MRKLNIAKTTLINILGGTVIKSVGSVNVWGFDIDKNPEIFYESDSQLYDILKSSIKDIDSSRKKAHKISKPLARFSWEQTAKEYDDKLLILYNQIMDSN